MSLSNTSLPKPDNWQVFERAARVLIACVLDDPKTQVNGRSGQEQCGVDIYGYRSPGHIVGVQCKQKHKNNVTVKELRSEVDKAKKFRPRLSEFILITTAPRDQKIQECARTITDELANTSHPFHVSVWGWEDITEHAAGYVEAWKAFDPAYSPFTERGFEMMSMKFDDLKQTLESLNSKTLPSPTHPTEQKSNKTDENTPLHGQITAFQTLVESGHVLIARDNFLKLRREKWAEASRSERYRILVGIATTELRMERHTEAGVLLLDAFNECPEHKNALSNRATGLLLQNRHEEATEVARQILSSDENNADAAGTLIQALAEDKQCTDPRAELPEYLRTVKEVQIGYVHFLRCRNNPSWVDEARAGAKLYPDCTLLQQFAAEAVLEELTREGHDSIIGGILQKVTMSDVNEAIELLLARAREAIDKGYGLTPSLAHNAALALRFTDKGAQAAEILDVAIKEYPENEDLRLQRSIIYLSDDDNPAALAIIPETPSNPELIGMKLEALVSMGRHDEAFALIRNSDGREFPDHVRNTFLAITARLYIENKQPQTAVDLVNSKVASAPENISFKNLQIQTYRAAGDAGSAMRSFEELLELVTDQTSLMLRLLLSYQARALGRDEVIVRLLKDRVATDRPSEGLYVLLTAAINSGALATAHEILDSLSDNLRGVEWIQRADIILSINSGHHSAEEKVTSYLRKTPSDMQMILARLRLWQRSGRDVEIKEFLNQLSLDELTGRPEEHIQLAAMLIHYGGNQYVGLEHAYCTLMDHWDRPQVHLAYQSLIFLSENIRLDLPISEIVSENVVVCVLSEGSERRHRIERKRHAFFEEERLAPGSELAGHLLGKRPGDTFDIGAKTVEVRWIKSVFLDAFHRSLGEFNQRFPNTGGLQQLSVDTNAQDPFVEIRSIVKAQAEAHQRMLKEYESKSLPLSFAAAFIGKDPIDAWGALPSMGMPFQVCRGTYEERMEALRLIMHNKIKGCVVDEITLALIRRIGVEQAVIDVCGKIHTSQSVVDSFYIRATEVGLDIGKTRGILAWREGQLVYDELPEGTLQKIADDRNEEYSWVKRVAAVIPAIPKHDFSQETRKVFNFIGHTAITDPAVAAEGNDLLLLSDDMGYRYWAKATFGVPAVWLQPVLITACKIGALTEDEYSEAINMLTLGGHTYSSLDATCLMRQARKDGFVLTRELSLLIEVLGGPSADLRANSAVMSAFIDGIMGASIDRLSATKIIGAVFSSIIKGRTEDQRKLVLLILDQIHVNKNVVTEYAFDWVLGHSIGMPYFPEILELSKRISKRQ